MSCPTGTPIKRSVLIGKNHHHTRLSVYHHHDASRSSKLNTPIRLRCSTDHHDAGSSIGSIASTSSTELQSPVSAHLQRRAALTTPVLLALTATVLCPPSSASLAGVQPQEGDCTDCIGEVNSTLNACPLSSESCVSTLNDDELHFAAPWQYEESTATAVDELIRIATGGDYEPGLIAEPFGVSRLEAAGYVVKGVLAVLQNGSMPERPERQRATDIDRFDGTLVERKTTGNGSEYVRIVFGGNAGNSESGEVVNPSRTIDAEFLFLVNDSIVNIRANSRGDPGAQDGELALSFTSGLTIDKNIARRRMEALRTALRWEPAPVITDFDPKFNPEAPVWLEKVFRPFDTERNNFQPSGISYPVE